MDWINATGHVCEVVSPAHTPRRAGDHVKTDRRDAVMLARLSRAGVLTTVWVPDEAHEAIRDLIGAREVAAKDAGRPGSAFGASCCATVLDILEPSGRSGIAFASPLRYSCVA
jgi:hypothetical protein